MLTTVLAHDILTVFKNTYNRGIDNLILLNGQIGCFLLIQMYLLT